MATPELSFVLSLWGAGLATALALLKVIEFRYAQGYNLLIIPKISTGFSSVEIDVVNMGRRPITIRGVSIVYGLTAESGTEVGKGSGEFPKLVEEGRFFSTSILRSELIASSGKIPSLQRPYSSLWVVATSASGKRFVWPLAVDHSIVPGNSRPGARSFIAADLFLGMPQLLEVDSVSELGLKSRVLLK